ncbi:hypothetical protein M9H77_04210 [Catharanthus roseus]|uniref:Uncharacterized protein n=1 Tax=Catharanthus roseus TaxID=4058 RepID=A0ACC0CDN3_CATRO|nr:hypothetical protein M9H77_04210 [Catharanthus roseus]
MGGPELAGNPTSSTPDLQVIAMTFSQYVANSMKEGEFPTDKGTQIKLMVVLKAFTDSNNSVLVSIKLHDLCKILEDKISTSGPRGTESFYYYCAIDETPTVGATCDPPSSLPPSETVSETKQFEPIVEGGDELRDYTAPEQELMERDAQTKERLGSPES